MRPGPATAPNYLTGASCPSAAACDAAGSFGNSKPDVAKTLIEQGTAWRVPT
jgi:hypothetical protein